MGGGFDFRDFAMNTPVPFAQETPCMEEDQFTALPGRLMNLTKGKTGRSGESTRYGQAEGQKEDELTAPDVQSG